MQIVLDRLLSRPFTLDDLTSVHEGCSDADVFRYLVFGPASAKVTSEFLQMAIDELRKVPITNIHLATVELKTGQVIGAFGLTNISPLHQEAELGYWLRRDRWHLGYATEAAKGLVAYGFRELKLHRVFAMCRPANKASAAVLEKLGMTKEGHLREHRFVRGRWEDSLLYSTLAQEWNRGPAKVQP